MSEVGLGDIWNFIKGPGLPYLGHQSKGYKGTVKDLRASGPKGLAPIVFYSVLFYSNSIPYLNLTETRKFRWEVPSFDYTGQHTKCIHNQIVDFSPIQCSESKYGLRIQFLAIVVMIHEVWLNA